MKKTNRLFSLVFATLFTALFMIVPVFAASASASRYEIKEAKFSIEIPDDLSVAIQGDKVQAGSDANIIFDSTLAKEMENQGIYIVAISDDLSFEMDISIESADVTDFHNTSNEELEKAFVKDFEKRAPKGYKATNAEIYRHHSVKFVRTDYVTENTGNKDYWVNYFAAHNGKAIKINFWSYGKEFSFSKQLLIEDAMDSVNLESSNYVANPYSGPNIALSIAMTLGFYVLPIAIYRFGIIKRRVPKKKARNIAIIYGIISYLVLHILMFVWYEDAPTGAAAALTWGTFNYYMLREKKEKEQKKENTIKQNTEETESTNKELSTENLPEEKEKEKKSAEAIPEDNNNKEEKADTSEVRYCIKCGAKLTEGSAFCHHCGAKVVNTEDN